MSYPDPNEKDGTPHLDAIAIGFGVLSLIAVIAQAPAWAHMLGACLLACWAIGWALKLLWRFARWCLEIEP
jgi:hypothetical protein